jgi:hypothetical protein
MANEPTNGNEKDRNAPTVRDLKEPVLPSDTVPEIVGLYVPPRPLPGAAEHRTLDLRSVRLSDQADPRRALTERRLVSPPKPPKRRYWPAALVALGSVALGTLVWAALRARGVPAPSSTGVREAPALGATSSAPKITIAPLAPLRTSLPPAASSSTPEVNTEAPPPPSKATRANDSTREAPKKRKDPWLE